MTQHVVTAEYLTRQQTSKMTGFAVATLDEWRYSSKGPRFVKVGRAVRYRRADVLAWMDAHTVGGDKA